MRISTKTLIIVSLLAIVCALAGNAMAESISQIEAAASGTTHTLDNASGQYPVISAILSQPGTVNGKTYTSWSYMVNDGTGSAVVYGVPTGYTTPAVGDTVTVTAKYSPYHQIPELTVPAVIKIDGPAAVLAPKSVTIPDINLSTLPLNVAGYMLDLKNVTISGISDNFGVANLTGTITDSSSNSMTLYYWPTSYSVENANLFGQAIPTGPVNMTGFVSVYNSVAEFTPMTITTVPEPNTLVLLSAALATAAATFIRRKFGK